MRQAYCWPLYRNGKWLRDIFMKRKCYHMSVIISPKNTNNCLLDICLNWFRQLLQMILIDSHSIPHLLPHVILVDSADWTLSWPDSYHSCTGSHDKINTTLIVLTGSVGMLRDFVIDKTLDFKLNRSSLWLERDSKIGWYNTVLMYLIQNMTLTYNPTRDLDLEFSRSKFWNSFIQEYMNGWVRIYLKLFRDDWENYCKSCKWWHGKE